MISRSNLTHYLFYFRAIIIIVWDYISRFISFIITPIVGQNVKVYNKFINHEVINSELCLHSINYYPVANSHSVLNWALPTRSILFIGKKDQLNLVISRYFNRENVTRLYSNPSSITITRRHFGNTIYYNYNYDTSYIRGIELINDAIPCEAVCHMFECDKSDLRKIIKVKYNLFYIDIISHIHPTKYHYKLQ